MMTPLLRRMALTAHVTSSVGWLGAVAGFLVLSVAGIASHAPATVLSAYLAMDLVGRYAIVPMSLAAVATGLVQSLGTEWGLVRFYWVLVKFALTLGATFLLVLHQYTAVAQAARRVSSAIPGTMPGVGRLGTQLVGDSGVALGVLVVITTLSVFKPWGRTPYGRRLHLGSRDDANRSDLSLSTQQFPSGLKIFLAIIGLLVLAFVARHIAGGGLGSHGH